MEIEEIIHALEYSLEYKRVLCDLICLKMITLEKIKNGYIIRGLPDETLPGKFDYYWMTDKMGEEIEKFMEEYYNNEI